MKKLIAIIVFCWLLFPNSIFATDCLTQDEIVASIKTTLVDQTLTCDQKVEAIQGAIDSQKVEWQSVVDAYICYTEGNCAWDFVMLTYWGYSACAEW